MYNDFTIEPLETRLELGFFSWIKRAIRTVSSWVKKAKPVFDILRTVLSFF
jgi:hypothetical protein